MTAICIEKETSCEKPKVVTHHSAYIAVITPIVTKLDNATDIDMAIERAKFDAAEYVDLSGLCGLWSLFSIHSF